MNRLLATGRAAAALGRLMAAPPDLLAQGPPFELGPDSERQPGVPRGEVVARSWGEGGHNLDHGGAVFPDTMRWRWRDAVSTP